MDKCTHEVRLQYWKNIISQCHARPEGQTAKQWMSDNGICEQTYYLWQRKIRQQVYEQMQSSDDLPAVSERQEITFAEISVPDMPASTGESLPPASAPAIVIRTGTSVIELSDEVPERLLRAILREVSHA